MYKGFIYFPRREIKNASPILDMLGEKGSGVYIQTSHITFIDNYDNYVCIATSDGKRTVQLSLSIEEVLARIAKANA